MHGAMHTNINLTAATAMLPGVLSDWARPLANLSDPTLFTSAFARLGLSAPDWIAPLANLSELASLYGPRLTNVTEWQARLSNLSDMAFQYYSAVNLSEFIPVAWSDISIPAGDWTKLVAQHANLSELVAHLARLNLTDWESHAASLSDLAAKISNHTAGKWPLEQLSAIFRTVNGSLPGPISKFADTPRAGYNNLLGL